MMLLVVASGHFVTVLLVLLLTASTTMTPHMMMNGVGAISPSSNDNVNNNNSTSIAAAPAAAVATPVVVVNSKVVAASGEEPGTIVEKQGRRMPAPSSYASYPPGWPVDPNTGKPQAPIRRVRARAAMMTQAAVSRNLVVVDDATPTTQQQQDTTNNNDNDDDDDEKNKPPFFAKPLMSRVETTQATRTFKSNLPLLVIRIPAPSTTREIMSKSGEEGSAEGSNTNTTFDSTFREDIPDEPKTLATLWASDCGVQGAKPSEWENATLNNKQLTCSFFDTPSYDKFMGIEVRGRSSRRFGKKQYSIELRKQIPSTSPSSATMTTTPPPEHQTQISRGEAQMLSKEPTTTTMFLNDTKGRLAGMPKGEDFVINGPFVDRSLIRNAFAYRIGRAMSDADGKYYVPRSEPVELFWLKSKSDGSRSNAAFDVNDPEQYGGVHVVKEALRVGKNRVDVRKFDADAAKLSGHLPPWGPSYLFEVAVEGLERWSACDGDSTNHVQCTLTSGRGGPVDYASTLPNWFHLYNHGGANAKPHQNRIDLSSYGTEASTRAAMERYNANASRPLPNVETAARIGIVESSKSIRREGSKASRNVGGSVRIALRHPKIEEADPTGTNDDVKNWLRAHLASFESTLFGPCSIPSPDQCPSAYTNANLARRSSYRRYVHHRTWVDWLLLQELTGNVDAYTSSVYLHKQEGDPRLRMGPAWDFNLAFGLSTVDGRGEPDNGRRSSPDGQWLYNYFLERCPALPGASGGVSECTTSQQRVSRWYGRLLEDPKFRSAVAGRWKYLRRNGLTDADVNALITDLKESLSAGGATKRELRRWPYSDRTSLATFGGRGLIADPPDTRETRAAGGEWEAEVERVRSWVMRRLRWMDEQLLKSNPNLPASDALSERGRQILPSLLPGPPQSSPSSARRQQRTTLPGLPPLF